MYSEKEKKKILELAKKYVKKGRFQEAITEYQRWLSEDPQDLNIRNVIGDLYVDLGQKDNAITEFKKIAYFYEKKGLFNQSLAIYKKINRLNPADDEVAFKLANLLSNQGFLSEAKNKYLEIAEQQCKENKTKNAISAFEKVLKFDKKDHKVKLTLADIYAKEGLVDRAIDEFNEVAEFKIKNNEWKEAKDILKKARGLKEGDLRTLANLIEILKKERKKEEALDLIEEVLKRDKDNLQALSFLGSLHFEDQNFKKARETYEKILSLRSKDVEARIKLGRIHIEEGKLDEVFDLYEPLVDSLLKRKKEEKAIGLLGLILATKKVHLPTIEKLASIYKSNKQLDNLELAYRAILEECRRKSLKEKSLSVLREMHKIFPMDEEYYMEFRKIKRELGMTEEEAAAEEPPVFIDEAKEIIKETLDQADLYVEQGLIRNARRILENLRAKFPSESIIEEKIKALNQLSPQVREEEIPERVERVAEEEIQKLGKDIKKKHRMRRLFSEEGGEEKLTAADVFAETDIIPIISQEEKEIKYYDLKERVDEELAIIQSIRHQQMKRDTADLEKELSDIVSEFRRGMREKIDKEDYESHFSLGIAYLEQELVDEAIEEFKLACKDEKRAVDCYSILSFCYRKKKDYKQALDWLEQALEISKKGSSQYFGLKYELAALYEEMKEREKALSLYNEIKKWNPKYRDTTDRIENLEKKFSK